MRLLKIVPLRTGERMKNSRCGLENMDRSQDENDNVLHFSKNKRKCITFYILDGKN